MLITGKNDLCPCGSGIKYKKCCLDTRDVLKQNVDQLHKHVMVAFSYYANGDLLTAGKMAKDILTKNPKHPQALFLCAAVMFDGGQYLNAANFCVRAISVDDTQANYYNLLALSYLKLGRLELAQATAKQGIKLDPKNCELYTCLATSLLSAGDLEEALPHLYKALEINPGELRYYLNIASCLSQLHRYEDIRKLYTELKKLYPRSIFRVPIVTLSVMLMLKNIEEIQMMRDNLNQDIDEILETQLELFRNYDPNAAIDLVKNPLFALAYHNQNDKQLAMKIHDVYRKNVSVFNYTAQHVNNPRPITNRKLKIGFISYYFWSHSVGKCFNPLIMAISKLAEHEVYIFTEKTVHDDELEKLYSAINYVELPRNHKFARQILSEFELDILVYADIGMNDETYCLALTRLAPIQCCLPGHPVTTGINTIDYYLSWQNMETENAEEHYSETLIALEHQPFIIQRPAVPENLTANKATFYFAENTNIYTCPMKLHKVHPDFDEIIGNILRKDPNGIVILVEDDKHAEYAQILHKRLHENIPDVVDRVNFHPWINGKERFFQFLMMSDVLLDTVHFGGGTTSHWIFSVGTPIVTWPGTFMRSRITYACYKAMGVMEPVARDKEHYVELAVQIATNKQWREEIKSKILANNHLIYDNLESAKEMSQLFTDLYTQRLDNNKPIISGRNAHSLRNPELAQQG